MSRYSSTRSALVGMGTREGHDLTFVLVHFHLNHVNNFGNFIAFFFSQDTYNYLIRSELKSM